tara:strand:+ start:535 stop:801 length:267 start_codon:yes stop_codon:yes gene_type:complete
MKVNWIDAYYEEHGELPVVPSWMYDIVLGYTDGMKVSEGLLLRTPSGQFYHNMNPWERKQWRELIEWLSGDVEDYKEKMIANFPAQKG